MNDTSDHVEAGKVARARGDLQGAERAFKVALAAQPNSVDIRLSLASVRRDLLDFENAYKAILPAIEAEPSHQWVWHEYGLIAIAEGDWIKALRIYQEALKRRPSFVHRVQLCQCLVELGHHGRAAEILSKLTAEDPKQHQAWSLRLRIAHRSANDNLIVSVAGEALQAFPSDGQFRMSRAEALARQRRYSDALIDLEAMKVAGTGDMFLDARVADYTAHADKAHEAEKENSTTLFPFTDALTCYAAESGGDSLRRDAMAAASLSWAGSHVEALNFAVAHYQAIPQKSGTSGQTLLQTLRWADTLGRADMRHLRNVSPRCSPAIPKVIVQFWDKDPLPDVQREMDRWQTINPDYQYRIFSEKTAREFIDAHMSQECLDVYDYAYHPAMKSDIFRLYYLLKFGGVYIDADEHCAIPLNRWLVNGRVELAMSHSQDPNTYINNWFIAARPDHPVISIAINKIVEDVGNLIKKSSRGYIWEVTGPGNLTRAFLEWVCAEYGEPSEDEPVKGVSLISESCFRRVVRWKTDMVYRTIAERDWRKA